MFIYSLDIDKNSEKWIFSCMRGQKLTELDRIIKRHNYRSSASNRAQYRVSRPIRSEISPIQWKFNFRACATGSGSNEVENMKRSTNRSRTFIWDQRRVARPIRSQVMDLTKNYGRTDWHTEWLTDGPTDRRTPPTYRPPTDRSGLKP